MLIQQYKMVQTTDTDIDPDGDGDGLAWLHLSCAMVSNVASQQDGPGL